jgi:hypothetical protein
MYAGDAMGICPAYHRQPGDIPGAAGRLLAIILSFKRCRPVIDFTQK